MLANYVYSNGSFNSYISDTQTYTLNWGGRISVQIYMIAEISSDGSQCVYGCAYEFRGVVRPTQNTNFFAAALIDINENDAYTLYAVMKNQLNSLEADSSFFYPNDPQGLAMAKTMYYLLDNANPTGECSGTFVITPLNNLNFQEEPTEEEPEPIIEQVEQDEEEVGQEGQEAEEVFPETEEAEQIQEEALEDYREMVEREERERNFKETGFYESDNERKRREEMLDQVTYEYVEVGDYNGDILELYNLAVEGKGPFEVFITDGNFNQKLLSVVGIYELPALRRTSNDDALIEGQTLQLKVKDNYRVSMQLYAQINIDENTAAEQSVDILFERNDQLFLNPAKIADKYGRLNNNINQGIPFLKIRQDGKVVFEDENIVGQSLESITYYKNNKRGLALQDIENLFQLSVSSVQKYMPVEIERTQDEPAGIDENGFPYWIDENGEATYSPTYQEGSVIRKDMEDDTPTESFTGTPDNVNDRLGEGISTGTLSIIGLLGLALVAGIVYFTFRSRGGVNNV